MDNQDLPKEPIQEELSEAYSYTTYLIGAMEKTSQKDDGSEQRAGVEKELLLRKVYPINPVRLEANKTGMTTEELKEKMNGWVASGNWAKFTEKAREIWKGIDYFTDEGLVHIPGDMDYVAMSDWVTFTFNKGDHPCGSFGEAYDAMKLEIPIYLITDIVKKELPKSLLQWICISEGEVFNSLGEYLKFVDEKYKLKRVEVKKQEPATKQEKE